jgi:hypothetical protein
MYTIANSLTSKMTRICSDRCHVAQRWPAKRSTNPKDYGLAGDPDGQKGGQKIILLGVKEAILAKYSGTVQRSDLEGGSWIFVTDQGVTYQLKGGGADLLSDGVKAEVEGRLKTGEVGIAMIGDVLEVTSYRILS